MSISIQNVYPFRTTIFANQIYIYGNMTLTQLRQQYPDYYIPVETYAANNFTDFEFQMSLENKYISQAEYDETMQYKTK